MDKILLIGIAEESCAISRTYFRNDINLEWEEEIQKRFERDLKIKLHKILIVDLIIGVPQVIKDFDCKVTK